MFDSLLNALFVVGLNYVICEKEVTVKTSTVETLIRGHVHFPVIWRRFFWSVSPIWSILSMFLIII